MLGGMLPLLLGGDLRLFFFIMATLCGISMVLLLYRMGLDRQLLLMGLGVSMVINPNKFFLTTGVTRQHFGGIPAPFISLTDLVFFCMLIAMIVKSNKATWLNSFTLFEKLMIGFYVLAMAVSIPGSIEPPFGVYHLMFEFKCILLFVTVVGLGQERCLRETLSNMRLMFAGIAMGTLMEVVAVIVEYNGLIPPGTSFMGITVGGFKESLAGMLTSRVGGTYRHPNYLAIPMAAMLVPFTALALTNKKAWRFLFACATLSAGFCLALTLSRGGWLAACVSIAVCTMVMLSTKEGIRFIRRNSMLVSIILVVGLVTGLSLSDLIRYKLFHSDPTNIDARIALNDMALDIIKDHPLQGVGLNNSVQASEKYGMMEQFTTSVGLPPVIHNIYLLLAAEIGIPGLLAFVLFGASVCIKGFLVARRFRYIPEIALPLMALAAGLLAYLLADLFGPGLRKQEIAYQYWWHLGCVLLYTNALLDQLGITHDGEK